MANFLKIFYFSFKKKHAHKHALCARPCYNHLAVIIARETKTISARAIFDNQQCNFIIKAFSKIALVIIENGAR